MLKQAVCIASAVADREDADVVLTARDTAGRARLRTVDSDGSITADGVTACGTGASLAFERLESAVEAAGEAIDLLEGMDLAHDVIRAVAECDAATAGEADVWTLTDDGSPP